MEIELKFWPEGPEFRYNSRRHVLRLPADPIPGLKAARRFFPLVGFLFRALWSVFPSGRFFFPRFYLIPSFFYFARFFLDYPGFLFFYIIVTWRRS